jgi:acyl carrier protein
MLDKTSLTSRLLEIAYAAAPRLADVEGDPTSADLRAAGLSSMAAVRMMLEIEAAFNLTIPDSDLTPENFANIVAIEQLVRRLSATA